MLCCFLTCVCAQLSLVTAINTLLIWLVLCHAISLCLLWLGIRCFLKIDIRLIPTSSQSWVALKNDDLLTWPFLPTSNVDQTSKLSPSRHFLLVSIAKGKLWNPVVICLPNLISSAPPVFSRFTSSFTCRASLSSSPLSDSTTPSLFTLSLKTGKLKTPTFSTNP